MSAIFLKVFDATQLTYAGTELGEVVETFAKAAEAAAKVCDWFLFFSLFVSSWC